MCKIMLSNAFLWIKQAGASPSHNFPRSCILKICELDKWTFLLLGRCGLRRWLCLLFMFRSVLCVIAWRPLRVLISGLIIKKYIIYYAAYITSCFPNVARDAHILFIENIVSLERLQGLRNQGLAFHRYSLFW